MTLLNDESDSEFMTRKWNIANDQSNTNYNVGNKIIYNIEVLTSYLCDYNDAFILVRGDINIIGQQLPPVAFKNWAPFTRSITKIDRATIVDAEELD